MGVVIERPGLKPVHCETVRDLAKWFCTLIPDDRFAMLRPINRMAEHCLCPIDIEESARLSGYAAEPDVQHINYVARPTPE